MKNYWLDQAKKRLEADVNQPSDVPFERLREQGMIDDRGNVTGKLHRWEAFLAITEVSPVIGTRQVRTFLCLKPVFGMPGSAKIEVSRESMVDYLKGGKKIVTATWDKKLAMWKEGCNVRLSPRGFVRCDSSGDDEDNVGQLPKFQPSHSRP